MKTEINLENKARFFGLYYGQIVLCVKGGDPKFFPTSHWNTIQTYTHFNDAWIELKPLSSITDDDIKMLVAIMIDDKPTSISIKFSIGEIIVYVTENRTFDWTLHVYCDHYEFRVKDSEGGDCSIDQLMIVEAFDYLRSKGYAIPYMGLSVDKMVEAEWIKIA